MSRKGYLTAKCAPCNSEVNLQPPNQLWRDCLATAICPVRLGKPAALPGVSANGHEAAYETFVFFHPTCLYLYTSPLYPIIPPTVFTLQIIPYCDAIMRVQWLLPALAGLSSVAGALELTHDMTDAIVLRSVHVAKSPALPLFERGRNKHHKLNHHRHRHHHPHRPHHPHHCKPGPAKHCKHFPLKPVGTTPLNTPWCVPGDSTCCYTPSPLSYHYPTCLWELIKGGDWVSSYLKDQGYDSNDNWMVALSVSLSQSHDAILF